jgi:hypothetical protein
MGKTQKMNILINLAELSSTTTDRAGVAGPYLPPVAIATCGDLTHLLALCGHRYHGPWRCLAAAMLGAAVHGWVGENCYEEN